MALKKTTTLMRDGVIFPIPNDRLARIFSQVACKRVGKELEVFFTFLAPPGADWNTVLALDASESMRPLWGKTLTGDIPLQIQERYFRQNLVFDEEREGKVQRLFRPEAYQDAIAQGFLKWTENHLEPKARAFLELLSAKVDVNEACNLMFWGCQNDPGWINLGEIPRKNCRELSIPGNEAFSFGKESKLLPLIQFLVGNFASVSQTLVVILTDGGFSDLEDLVSFSINLGILIKAKKLNPMKFVMIGMGTEVEKKNLSRLGELKTGLEYDLWDCRVADDRKEPLEILGGLYPEDMIVTPPAVILDSKGKVIQEFKAGLTYRTTIRLPIDATSFSLQFPPDPVVFDQTLQLPFRKSLA